MTSPSLPASAALQAITTALRAQWQGISPRERRLILLAATVVAVVLLWSVAWAPAWRTLASAPQAQEAASATLEHIRAQAREARTLTEQPTLGRQAARAELERATQQLPAGTATLRVDDQQATVQLDHLDARSLANWLATLQSGAHMRPTHIDLQGTGSPARSWSGSVVLSLPPED